MNFFFPDKLIENYYEIPSKIDSLKKVLMNYKQNKKFFLEDLLNLKMFAWIVLINYLIGKVGILIFVSLLYYTLRNYKNDFLPLIAIVIIQFIIISIIQYEPRHSSKLLGILILLAAYAKGREE